MLCTLQDDIAQWWILPVSVVVIAVPYLLSRFYQGIKTKKQ